jgi:hypothetical protein
MGVDWWTRGLAIYGAVVATAAGTIQLLEHRKDRAKIRVSAMFARENNPSIPLKFLVKATNIGTRPVTVQGIATREGKDQYFWVNARYLPKLLQPTEEVAELSANLTFITDKTTELCVFDPGGKEWKLPKKRLNELKKSAANRAAGNGRP